MSTKLLPFSWMTTALRSQRRATAPPPAVSTSRDDEIRQALLERLGEQPWWDAEVSNVYVEDGTAVIQGLLTNAQTGRLARKMAATHPGVRAVHDARRRSLQWLG